MFYRVLLLLGCISYNCHASFEAAVAKQLHQACASKKQKPQVPAPQPLTKPKGQTEQAKRVTSQKYLIAIKGAKQLIQARGWGQLTKDVIALFNARFAPELRSLVHDFIGDCCKDDKGEHDEDKYERIDNIVACPNPKNRNRYYYLVQELSFTQNRESVKVIFDRCSQKRYQNEKAINSHYQGSGYKCYSINHARRVGVSNKVFEEQFDEDALGYTMDKRFIEPSSPCDWYTHIECNESYRIEDPIKPAFSDDGFLKAQLEPYVPGRMVPFRHVNSHGEIEVSKQFQWIYISVWINMGKLLKVLLDPNFSKEVPTGQKR